MQNPSGRVLPSSVTAEQSILGSMMLSEHCALTAVERLREEDFFLKAHRRIFCAMTELVGLGKPIDLVTVTEKIEQKAKLSVDELTYLSELTQTVPSVRNIGSYIDIVRKKSMLRHLIEICGDVTDLAFEGTREADEVVAYAGDAIYKLSNDKNSRSLEHIRFAMTESYNQIVEASKSGSGIMGLQTGFALMDQTLSGLQKGQLIVIAGRPGMGKTSFALNIVEHVALKLGKTVAVFSLEMPREQLATRMLCSQAQIDSQKLRSGKLKSKEFFALADAMEPFVGTSLYVDDNSALNTTEMQAKLRRLRQQTGALDLVVIDYLQLMSAPGHSENRQNEVSMMTRTLKIMAKELGVPIVLLSQLSRANEKRPNKKPMLSDLRESGSIEQDADVVILLYRDDYYGDNQDAAEAAAKKGEAIINIAKQRNGPTLSIKVKWRGELTKYQEIDYHHDDE